MFKPLPALFFPSRSSDFDCPYYFTMISTDQWRKAIGCYSAPKSKHTNDISDFDFDGERPENIKRLNKHLFILAMCLWTVAGSVYLIYQPNVNTAALCGDIELNPGPSIEEQFASLTEFVGSRFDEINNNITALRQEVYSLRDQLNTVKTEFNQKCDLLYADIDANAEAVEKISNRVATLESAIEKQDQYQIRENVLLHNVAEADGETFWTARSKVIDIINKNLPSTDTQLTEHDVTRVQRLGKTPNPDKPRPIIVRFANIMDKLKVLKTRQALREQDIGISNDLTKTQRAQLEKLKSNGQSGYYKNGHLYVIPTNGTGDSSSSNDRVIKRGHRKADMNETKR